jgi:spermidine synthase
MTRGSINPRAATARLLALVGAGCVVLALAAVGALAQRESLVDEAARAALLRKPDGRIAHIESEYNDIYINKRRNELTMAFQIKGWDYTESVTNLSDPDDLVLRYAQTMMAALLYPEEPRRILMIGLGGASISTYLGRHMPDIAIDTVEIDRKVIETAKTYFGVRETERVRYLDGDGRVFLNRNRDQLYDLIILDAYHGGYVPFHLLTKEFYTLIKQRLTPGGAAAFNVHDGTKLYHSTAKTLADVFPTLEIYPSGVGEAIMIVTNRPVPDAEALASRATALQERYNFRFPLPQVLQKRMANPASQTAGGEIITDNFAPVNFYDTIGRPRPKKK